MRASRFNRSVAGATLGVAISLMVFVLIARVSGSASASIPPLQLEGGAASLDELMRSFLNAIEAKNGDALSALRVSEREYVELVMPGTVEPDEASLSKTREQNEYFWGVLNEKSAFHSLNLINKYGGEHLSIRQIDFDKGVKQYKWFKAYRRLRLAVSDASGREVEIPSGSVVELGGRFKFASFIVD